jgi:hypothetical protein
MSELEMLELEMSDDFKQLLDTIENDSYYFINKEFKIEIQNVVNNFMINLNANDKRVLTIFTLYIIDVISIKYHFKSEKTYYDQWKQNNNRDIKGAILLLLPFIDDKTNKNLFNKITDLNQLLYAYKKDVIPKDILLLEREEILSTHFEYGNMGIGLINQYNIKKNLLELKLTNNNNEKLIYRLIHYNFIGLLQTLEIMNGKYYINWINIVPLNLNNYNNSLLYARTVAQIDQYIHILQNNDDNESTNFLSKNLLYYSGLWFGDLYNVIRIKYYEEGKKSKWLFFPYEISPTNKIYLINGLNRMLNLELILETNELSFNDLSTDTQYKFTKQVTQLITNLKNGNSLLENIVVDFEIVKYCLIYLINNHNTLTPNNSFNKFKLSQELDDEANDDFNNEDLKTIRNITNENIINTLEQVQKTHLRDLWDYLKSALNLLIACPYGKFLIVNNKISTKYYYEPFNDYIKQLPNYESTLKNKLNLKNIYNISKSLSHTDLNDWTVLDRNYLSLDVAFKHHFFNKIYNIRAAYWINLNRNLRRQFLGNPYPPNMIDSITAAFRLAHVILVFEELTSNGLLNTFQINKEITNNLLLPQESTLKKKETKRLLKELFNDNKKEWLESYYYLTNKKIKDMPPIRVEKKTNNINNKDKYKEISYFDLIVEEQSWPLYYAMDWISQISFFQHYIYHQVLYVTGATGQGKSTQVPKLLLYALKVIDYKSNGKVICTQPRIPPTVNNSTRIAEELGLPIEQLSNNSSDKLKTNNYYVEYKHQNASHLNTKKLHSSLKIVTDGTLLEELKKNPTLKVNIKDKLTNTNLYDIIIVDEAHEHNINMDIIIALARQTCYFNNQVRLIIVSATMDDDEPIYRRYFSNINDNLLYPIKIQIQHPLLEHRNNFLPYAYLMDRRYHISPPGETTQYRVNEIYLDEDPQGDTEKLASIKAQEAGYKKIMEICSKTTSGEILFFANGKREILLAVEYLNNNLPAGNVALPYFSELNSAYKNIIEKISSKISTIKNKRTQIHLEWGADYIEDLSVPNGLYKRSIIIATNVAEASVTIDGLAFVVDNGYAKVNNFNPILNKTKLEIEKISESSREQRKGRVGRTGDGTVYYMYKKDARRFIKPKYKITQEDIAVSLLGLLAEKNLNENNLQDNENYKRLIISTKLNPNIRVSLIRQQLSTEIPVETYTFDSNLYELYKQNYYINNRVLGNAHYDSYNKLPQNVITQMETNTENIFYMFNNGQIFTNILDDLGQFYLIHPFENSIRRNILNKIIKFKTKKQSYIPNIEYMYLLSYLINKNLLIDSNAIVPYNTLNNIKYANRNYIKTELSVKVLELISKYQITIEDAITLISATAMRCLRPVYELKLFLELIDSSLSKIVNPSVTWSEFYEIYRDSNTKSDLIFLYDIIKKIKSRFSNLLIFNIRTSGLTLILDKHYDTILKKFNMALINGYDSMPSDFNPKLWNDLLSLKVNQTLTNNYKQVISMDVSTLNILLTNIDKHESEITKWAIMNYFEPTIIIKLLKSLVTNYLTKNILENNEVFSWAVQFESTFNKYLTTGALEEKIIRSFLYGRPNQITFKTVKNSDKLVSLINFQLSPVFIKKIFELSTHSFSDETLTNLSNDLTFYLSYNKDDNLSTDIINVLHVGLLNQIEAEWLIPTLPLFFNPTFTDYIYNTSLSDDKSYIYFFNSDSFQRLRKELINRWNENYNIWDSIETPILSAYYKSITKYIIKQYN